MPSTGQLYDAVVIGGGFYGASIAIYLANKRGMKRVLLVERESSLLARASYNNQARVHNGYHYPRSFTTAYRSRINFPRFLRDWPDAVKKDFTKLYAVAKHNSKVTARQFERFCVSIGASIESANPALRKLFDSQLIEEVYCVQEYAFDSTVLAEWAASELDACGVEVLYGVDIQAVQLAENQNLKILSCRDGDQFSDWLSRYVFNCTYSGLNQLRGDFPGTTIKLKHEITEMALVRVPAALSNIGVTVMDGPFFSIMPFPARNLHTLSHVRYTPHAQWDDDKSCDPYEKLRSYKGHSRVDRMLRDVRRYMPALNDCEYVESLYEVKTILQKNEVDDGRPILYEKHRALPGCFSILGGKIDNIYDVLERLDMEDFANSGSCALK